MQEVSIRMSKCGRRGSTFSITKIKMQNGKCKYNARSRSTKYTLISELLIKPYLMS